MNLMNEGVLLPNELDDRDERREELEAQMPDNETIADIIAEMRGMGNYQRYSGDHARVLAGRLEAAHKRERGNAAKLREALDESRRIASDLGGCRLNDYWKLNEIVRVCDAALSTPPRNCDVGTAEEQHARFVSYCDRCDCPMGCDHRKNFVGILKPECASILTCFIRWAQMPYEEGGAK